MSFDQARSRGSQSWIQDPRFAPNDAPNDAPNVPTGWTNVHTGCLGPMVNGSQAQASWAGKQTWQANKLHGKTGRYQVVKAHNSRKPRTSYLTVTTFCSAHPRRACQIYGMAAIFKISQGVLLLTVFAPRCPSGCTCAKYHLSYVYPLIVILLGNVLAYRSKQFYDTAQQQSASPPGAATSSSTIPNTSTTKKESELV
jgi:hypothetical protein